MTLSLFFTGIFLPDPGTLKEILDVVIFLFYETPQSEVSNGGPAATKPPPPNHVLPIDRSLPRAVHQTVLLLPVLPLPRSGRRPSPHGREVDNFPPPP